MGGVHEGQSWGLINMWAIVLDVIALGAAAQILGLTNQDEIARHLGIDLSVPVTIETMAVVTTRMPGGQGCFRLMSELDELRYMPIVPPELLPR
jgi:hypothetical protein